MEYGLKLLIKQIWLFGALIRSLVSQILYCNLIGSRKFFPTAIDISNHMQIFPTTLKSF